MTARTWIGLLFVALLAACRGPAPEQISGATMGTRYSVMLGAGQPPGSLAEMRPEIEALLEQIENLSSTYRPDSALSLFNADPSTDWISVPVALCEAVAQTLGLSRTTRGAFDVTVGPLVNLWGFGPDVVAVQPPPAPELAAVKARVGYQQLQTRCEQGAMRKTRGDLFVDLSAWAKGHAVDRLAALLERHGYVDYLVEIGGELKVRGRNRKGEPWAVAIETPRADQRSVHSIVHLTGGAVATSGDYRNFFLHDGVQYSHAIDPRSGRPVRHSLASVTVLAPLAANADALATALLVLGPEEGMALAEQLGVASLFLVRRDQEFEARTSTAYKRMTQS